VTLALTRPRHRTDLVRELVARDIKLRYRRSVLGIAWSQLAPLSMIAVLAFVFGTILPLSIPHYPAFLVAGLLPWAWFQSATIAATGSVVGGRDLVRQPGFPVPMLPVVSVASTLINLVLALPVMFLFVGLSYGHIPVTVLALPIIMAVQFLVTLGPCYVLSAINVRFRDIGHIVEVAMLPLFYATPVFYVQPPARFHLVFALNPLAHLMGAYRDVLINDRWPNFNALGVLAGAAVVLIVVGYRFFDRLSIRFPEEL
jgi:homopolymeric O-antigen transport system permease protein